MNERSFLEGPYEKPMRFAFFETILFKGFAQPYYSAGGGGDIDVGPFCYAVKNLCCGEKYCCLG